MKIYRVIFTSIDIDESDHTVIVTTFFNKENALKYYETQLGALKEQQEELDMESYTIDEDEKSYERYLNGLAMEESVSLWFEEDNTYDEFVLQTQKKMQDEKDKEYEM